MIEHDAGNEFPNGDVTLDQNKYLQAAKRRMILALDLPSVDEALAMMEEQKDFFSLYKLGKQLHTASEHKGDQFVKHANKLGVELFFDLKFHDTPNTVYEAAVQATVPGVYMFDVHIAGGEAMCKKAVEASYEQAEKLGIERPKVIGVTVLTSLGDEDLKAQGLNISYDNLVLRRAELAKKWGLDGIVCPANKAGSLESHFGHDPNWLYVTPGVSWAGVAGSGQKQVYNPADAVSDCRSSLLVIGSATTKAGNVYNKIDGKKTLITPGTAADRREASYGMMHAMAEQLKAQDK